MAEAGAAGAAGPGGSAGTTAHRFFCHNCCIEFVEAQPEEYQCPYCARGFVERMEDSAPVTETSENTNAPSNNRPIIAGQISDIEIDDLDELPPDDRRSLPSNWNPPWNYRDPNNPQLNNSSTPSDLSNLIFPLSSGDRFRGFGGVGMESVLHQIMWQVTGGRAGGPGGAGGPLFLLGHEPNEYIMSNEGIDAIMSQLLWNTDNDGPPPLAQECIENLPEIIINEEQVLAKLQCTVCWELYNIDEKVRQLKCGHIYHQSCISPWLSLHATCPICRQSLTPPEASEPDSRTLGSRDPAANNPHPQGTQYPGLTSFLLRACGILPPDGSVATGTVSVVPSGPPPAQPANGETVNAVPATETPENNSSTNDSANPTAVNGATLTAPTPQPANAAPNRRHITASISPGHFVLMSSPHGVLDNMAEYIAFWTGSTPPVSSHTVSSTTSDVNSTRPPTNFDMDLD